MPCRISSSIIYLLSVFQRMENENHFHCYLLYLTSSSTLLFLLLSAPHIINHTVGAQRAHLSATPFSVLPKFSARVSRILVRTYMWDKRPKMEIHIDHHSFVRSFTIRRTEFKSKSPDKQEQCLGDGEDHCLCEYWNSCGVRFYLMASALFYKQPTDILTVS